MSDFDDYPRHLPRLRPERMDLMRGLTALDADLAAPAWTRSFECEESQRIAERLGMPYRPGSLLVELPAVGQRDMDKAGTLGSNYLVGLESPGATFIASLTAESAFMRAGSGPLPMVRGDIFIPRVSVPPTAVWLPSETTAISSAQPTIAGATAVPKTVAAHVTLSQTMSRQSNCEALLLSELARAVAATFDVAAFAGNGVEQPLGLVGTPGISSVAGTSFDWAAALAMMQVVEASGTAMSKPAFVTTPAVATLLRGRPRLADGDGAILRDGTISGHPCIVSVNAPAAALLFGDWSHAFQVNWNVLELRTDPFSGFNSGKLSVRAMLHADVLFAHAAAFAVRHTIT